MEDKLPSKEFDVWTLRHFIERHKDWDQRDEVQLIEYLQQLSNKITQGAKNTLNELDDLVASIDDTAVQISNINNEFQLLADKQFIENKVQEEDETVQIKVEKPVARETNNADTLVNNLKEALKNSFNAIDSHFEKVTVVVSDSDDDDDELKHETILKPRTFYKKLNLPSLSGNRQSEIDVNSAMSSDSDSVVEHPTNAFKDEESLSSNDIPEEDINSVIESKIHEPITQSVETHSNMFATETVKPKIVSIFADNDNDDLFNPPPLPNDYEEDLENDYNIFGNSSNMYDERTLWDDDDDDFSNEPPLPIHSDEPPQQVIKSNIQTNTEVPSIQQSLNAELRKRFQKDDNISSMSDNINVEPPKKKLPKGAVNILGGTDIKPYAANPDQNTKEAIISQISTSVTESMKNKNIENVNNSNKLLNKLSKSAVTSVSKDLIKEIQQIEKRSLFQQDSDDEDLFVEKKPIATLASRSKENSAIKIKSPRTIFSDSDSDDDFINSKSTTKPVISHVNDNHSTKLLDSSSEDDLFNDKSLNNKSTLKQKNTLFSSSVHDQIFNQSKQVNNEIKQKLESSIHEKNARQILNKKIVDELMESNSKESNILAENAVIRKESLPNLNALNRNITEPPPMNNPIKTLSSQNKTNLSKFFSSDEDDLDDMFLNVNKLNENRIKKDQTIHGSGKIVRNSNNELNESKVKMFDSSSDDDIFITNKSNNNLISSKINKLSDSEEIKTIGSKLNDNHAIINQSKITDNLDKTNSIKNKNMLSILSDDDEDDNYLSFNSSSDLSFNISNIHNLEENSKAMSLSSEEFLSPQTDLKNKNIFRNSSSESLLNRQNQKLIDEEEIAIPANEIPHTPNEDSIQKNILSILSSSDDEDQISFNSYAHSKNIEKETKEIRHTSNSSFENVLDNQNNSNILNEKKTSTTNNDKLFSSTENLNQTNQLLMLSNSDDEDLEINYKDTQKKTKFIESKTDSKESLNDYTDGSSFSTPNSRDEPTKILPGKLNKNAGAFINIAGLLPNSKKPLNISAIPKSASLDEKNDEYLPTIGTKLYSAGKERVKIQVKRRPQSRKARIAASRMSSIDIGHESNFQESSRLFSSTSDLVDHQSSSILNVTDFSNELQYKIQESFDTKLITNNDKIYEGSEQILTNNKVKKQAVLNLFDDDSNLFESRQKETKKTNEDKDKKEQIFHEGLSESKLIHKEHTENELPLDKQVKAIVEDQTVKEVIENESTSNQNTKLSRKSNYLFDDNDDIFSSKTEKVKKTSSLFDSDDEFEFSQKFTKKTMLKTNSIFGDDSDDDLFSSTNKLSASNLPLQKPIDNLSLQNNRSSADGYVKLAAESVAINPLESKET
ncbi:FAM21/CAPZIP domain [Cinara cedri]|uniref:FAM21/CAPZIP domain n=1 Tax=Cinara cedri TaxID=506608 RepID=A0A5E4MUI3_9HEMI|nr:FAM21/CAPZIP domain [Cinara cedri]